MKNIDHPEEVEEIEEDMVEDKLEDMEMRRMNTKDMIIDQEDIEGEREMKDIEVQQELRQIMITEIRNMSPTEAEDIDQEAEEEEEDREDREEDEGTAGRKEHKVNLHLLRR